MAARRESFVASNVAARRRSCGWELPFWPGDSSIGAVPDVTTRETVDDMDAVTGELVRAQAAHLRGIDIGQPRAEEIAMDIGRIVESVAAVRERLDFNDEPGRFDACLNAPAGSPRQRR